MSGSAVTIEEVAELIRRHTHARPDAAEPLGASTRLEDLGIESLQLVDIVATLEERHCFEFDPNRIHRIETLGGLVDLANEALSAATPEI